MRARFLVFSLALPVLLTGCTQLYSVRPGNLTPALIASAPEQRVAVWQHAVTVLLDQGYVPQVLNEAAGFISAKRREDLADDALAGTITLVSISPQGEVRVEVSGAGLFHSEQDFLKTISDRQNLLAHLIAQPGAPR